MIYDVKSIEYNIGLAINTVRKQKQLTLVDLEDLGGPTPMTVGSYENGRRNNITLKTALMICNALDVTIDVLLNISQDRNFKWVEDIEE